MRPLFFFVISSIAVAVNGPTVTIWCNGYKLMFQSNPSCGWALNKNNYTRKMSFHPLFVHLSVFRCLSILDQAFTLFSFLLFSAFMFCFFSAGFPCSASTSSPPFPLLFSVTVSFSALFPHSPLSFQPLSLLLSPQVTKCFSPRLDTYREESKKRGDNVIVVLDGPGGGWWWELRTVV